MCRCASPRDRSRKPAINIVVILQRDAELFEVVGKLRPAGRLARGLDRRQQQGHENADDGDHDE